MASPAETLYRPLQPVEHPEAPLQALTPFSPTITEDFKAEVGRFGKRHYGQRRIGPRRNGI